jgi:hypothetical protein
MAKSSVGELPLCRLDRTGQLPTLRYTNDPLLPVYTCVIQSVDDRSNTVRIKRYGLK